jgi:hypothetical protein
VTIGSSPTEVLKEYLKRCSGGVDLPEQLHHLPSSVRPHRQEVDDLGSILTVLVAVAHPARGDRVAVGLVTDQDVAEVRTR